MGDGLKSNLSLALAERHEIRILKMWFFRRQDLWFVWVHGDIIKKFLPDMRRTRELVSRKFFPSLEGYLFLTSHL